MVFQRKKYVAKKSFNGCQKPQIYIYFIIKAIDLLNDGGQLVVIFPDSWSKSKTGVAFKQFLMENCEIAEKISMENTSPFDDEVLTNVVILKFIKHVAKQKQIATQNRTALTDYLTIDLLSIARVRRGITTGANKLFINPPISPEDNSLVPILSSPKNYNGYSTENAILDKMLLVDEESLSQEVKKYLSDCSREIEENKKPKSLYDKKRGGGKWYPSKTFDCSGLIFSYFVRNEMKFAVNSSGALVRDNFYVIKSSLDMYVLFALMNNYFTYYQLEEAGKNMAQAYSRYNVTT